MDMTAYEIVKKGIEDFFKENSPLLKIKLKGESQMKMKKSCGTQAKKMMKSEMKKEEKKDMKQDKKMMKGMMKKAKKK